MYRVTSIEYKPDLVTATQEIRSRGIWKVMGQWSSKMATLTRYVHTLVLS